MDDAAKPRKGLIQHQVRGGIAGRAKSSFYHVAVQIDDDDIVSRHGLVAHARRFDGDQPALAVNLRHVAPGQGDQPVMRQLAIGGQHRVFQVV